MKHRVVFKRITITTLPDGRMTASNAAIYLGCSESFLASMRKNGDGPCFTKVGRRFHYYRKHLRIRLKEKEEQPVKKNKHTPKVKRNRRLKKRKNNLI